MDWGQCATRATSVHQGVNVGIDEVVTCVAAYLCTGVTVWVVLLAHGGAAGVPPHLFSLLRARPLTHASLGRLLRDHC